MGVVGACLEATVCVAVCFVGHRLAKTCIVCRGWHFYLGWGRNRGQPVQVYCLLEINWNSEIPSSPRPAVSHSGSRYQSSGGRSNFHPSQDYSAAARGPRATGHARGNTVVASLINHSHRKASIDIRYPGTEASKIKPLYTHQGFCLYETPFFYQFSKCCR